MRVGIGIGLPRFYGARGGPSGNTLTPPPVTTNLRWWLDGRAGVSGSAPRVSDWQDQWSNNYDFAQGTGADQPQTSTAGGKPSILFTAANTEFLAAGGSSTLLNTRFLHAGPCTVVIVCRLSTVAAFGAILSNFDDAAATIGFTIAQSNTSTSLRFRVGNGVSLQRNITAAGFTIDSNVCLSIRNSTTNYSIRQNGIVLSAAAAAATLTNADALGLPRVGQLTSGGSSLNGHILGMVAYDAYLSDGDVGSVETWATTAWV